MADLYVQPPVQPEKPPMPAVGATLKAEQVPTHRIRPLYRSTQIVWYVVGLIEVFLVLRLFLRLFAANPNAGFTKFIYAITTVFAGPFFIVFPASRSEGNVFEWSTILAMSVYLLFGWLIVKAIVMARPVTTEEAERKLPEQEKV